MTQKLKKWPIFNLFNSQFISKIQMVLVYGNFGNCCLIVTKDQTVYSVGNKCSTFKTNYNNRGTIVPKKIKESGHKIKTMAYGQGSFVLVLTEEGQVYSWGSWVCRHSPCHCHYSGPTRFTFSPKLDLQNDSVVDIACGDYHAIALTKTGNIYVCGRTASGQVPSSASSFSMVLNSVKVKLFRSISCGANHYIAVTNNGQLYSWGSNSLGQLGLTDTANCKMISKMISKITYLSEIVIEKVACGMNHTLALSDKGTLYCWGDNTYGQLGVTLGDKRSPIPIALKHLLKVLEIAASKCANISVAMGTDHKIFMWGECLGQRITIPTLISVDSIHDAFALYAFPTAMHQPFIIADEKDKKEDDVEIMKITDHIMAAFDDKTTSDLTMKVEGKPIYVHKPILKTRSKYFDAMFRGDWKENNDSVIDVCGFSYETYRTFLKFLYTNKIDATIPTENVIESLKLADCYNEDNFKAGYLAVLRPIISTDNTALLYMVAVQYNDSELKRCCIRFAVTRMREISTSSSFSELTQETMKNFIIEVVHRGGFSIGS